MSIHHEKVLIVRFAELCGVTVPYEKIVVVAGSELFIDGQDPVDWVRERMAQKDGHD